MLLRPYETGQGSERVSFLQPFQHYILCVRLQGYYAVTPRQKSSLYQETVHPVPQHKETPRSAHLCAGEYLQPGLFA